MRETPRIVEIATDSFTAGTQFIEPFLFAVLQKLACIPVPAAVIPYPLMWESLPNIAIPSKNFAVIAKSEMKGYP